ncbi:MAG: FecR domain-containing protein [Bacteroidota bacterium]
MINQDEAYNLMVKKLANEINADESTQLEQWLSASDAHTKTYADLQRIWNSAAKEELKVDIDAAWQNVNKRTTHKTLKLTPVFLVKVAAVFIAVALLSVIAYNNLKKTETSIATAANEVKKISLPDGSFVWLHEHSILIFHNNLKGSERKITLQGLAFFDVKRDEKHAFIISTPKGSVEVLGTSFEVSAYNTDTFERVTVSTGKVKFENKITGKNILLTRNMQGELSASGNESLKEVNAAELVSWKTAKLVFNNEPMDEVAEKISRYYHVELNLKNERIKNCRFTAAFENATLNEVLDAVSKALQLTYVKQANRVTINGEGCKAQ